MRIVTPPLVVNDDDEFKNDDFGRTVFGKSLMNLIQQSEDDLVISIDGQWGEGKTTFIKMWQGMLRNNAIPTLYLDAFEKDYSDNAFVFMASAITSYAEKVCPKSNLDKLKSLKGTAVKVGGALISLSAKVGIKAATLGLIGSKEIESVEELKSEIADSLSNAVEHVVEEKINAYNEECDLFASFRQSLADLPGQLTESGTAPLVVVIDELDRCKPLFAIEILEKVKHLFSVKGVVFVLVMHREQLEESIRCVYGQNIDANSYLQKFFTLEARIPKRRALRYNNDYRTYLEKLFELHDLRPYDEKESIISCVESLAARYELSLRQLERIFTGLVIYYSSATQNSFRVVPLIVLLAVVKVVRPAVFEKLMKKQSTYAEVVEDLDLLKPAIDPEMDAKLGWILGWLRFGLLTDEEFTSLAEDDELRRYANSSQMWFSVNKREDLIPMLAGAVNMFRVVE